MGRDFWPGSSVTSGARVFSGAASYKLPVNVMQVSHMPQALITAWRACQLYHLYSQAQSRQWKDTATSVRLTEEAAGLRKECWPEISFAHARAPLPHLQAHILLPHLYQALALTLVSVLIGWQSHNRSWKLTTPRWSNIAILEQSLSCGLYLLRLVCWLVFFLQLIYHLTSFLK